jgi:DNA gyrase subunit B
MYVGGTDLFGLHHLIYEMLDHFVEEAIAGRCTTISLKLFDDNVVSISGDSRGIPVDIREYDGEYKYSALELLMQGAIDKRKLEPENVYITGGLFGLGLSVINFMSDEMVVENHRDGFLWRATYREGLQQGKLEQVHASAEHGTTFTFKPDFTIFEPNTFDRERLIKRCQEIAYQVANLRITIQDNRNGQQYENTFYSSDGLKSLILALASGSEPLHDPIHVKRTVTIPLNDGTSTAFGVEFAFQFTRGTTSNMLSYINTVQTTSGGTHLSALKASILSVLNHHLEWSYGLSGRNKTFSWKGIERGLHGAIAIQHTTPRFESPTKMRLDNFELYGPVSGLVFESFASQRPTVRKILDHLIKRKSKAK